jgi:hypothetical protein
MQMGLAFYRQQADRLVPNDAALYGQASLQTPFERGSAMHGVTTPPIRAALWMALVLAASAAARADDGISTSISGYGTLGGTFTSDGNYRYRHDTTEALGAGTQFDIGLESRLGVQAVVDFGSGFSVTAQELAKERADGAFSLGTEWLFVQYVPDSSWKLRLGRVALPIFLLSDSINVGYAAPWFRAPNEIYGSSIFQYLDGVQVLWHHNIGQVGLGLGASYGNATQPYVASGTAYQIDVKEAYNVTASVQYGDFILRVAQTNLSVPEVLPLSATAIVSYVLHDRFTAVGLQYDNGRALVLSEWARRTEQNVPGFSFPAAASTEWYVAGGWRFGKLTPLLSYAEFRPVQSLSYATGRFETWSASLRYDVVRNVALKAEVSRAQKGNYTYWVIPDPASRERVNVYSVGADFVF